MSDHSPILAAIGELGIRFGRVEERLDHIIERLDHTSERLDRVDHRLDRVEESVARLREEVNRQRVDFMARLDRHQDTLTRMKDDITVETAAVDNTRERFTQFRNDYDQLAHQVSIVHRRLMQLEQRFDSREHGA